MIIIESKGCMRHPVMAGLFIISLLVSLLTCTGIKSTGTPLQLTTQPEPAVELAFTFTRLSGSASNQFAVWVENAEGEYIRTVYATRYTANGGWKRRETSLPVWVNKSRLSELSAEQIDVFSGATPRTERLTFIWDGTDEYGELVPAGNYIINLEGTLRWENQVIYRAFVRFGHGASISNIRVQYTGDAGQDRSMITDVVVKSLR